MLKLDNEDDEDEQETVERLKDLSATYQWYQVKEDGSEVEVFTGKTSMWGTYFKYNYAKFDFSEVRIRAYTTSSTAM